MVNSKEELDMVVRVAKEKNLLVFSDDIYDKFVYENGTERTYLGQLYDKTITFGGFSKTWGMTGWRIGYVAGPKDLIHEGLKDKYHVVKPDGAYFIFPEVPGGNGDKFVEKAWQGAK
jgi:aspartate/methionine/tyrosine aminotransferase